VLGWALRRGNASERAVTLCCYESNANMIAFLCSKRPLYLMMKRCSHLPPVCAPSLLSVSGLPGYTFRRSFYTPAKSSRRTHPMLSIQPYSLHH
jgi:hypothetical protein